MKRGVRALCVLACISAIGLIGGCATQPLPEAYYDPPGFFLGLLHGLTIFFSMIGSLFTDYRIYAFPNSGGWYDLGYLIGAAAALGGSGSAASSGAGARG
jgi:hypothetical protein